MSALHTRIAVAILALVGSTLARAAAPDLGREDRKPAALADGKFEPGRPALRYGDEAAWSCPTRGVHGIVADELRDLAERSKKPVPVADGRLCAVAEAFLSWEAKEAPRPGLTAFALQHFGVLGTRGRVLLATLSASDTDPREVASQVWEAIGNYGLNAQRARYGLMVQRLRKGFFRVATALVDEAPVALEPVPKALAAGEKAVIAGKLVGDLDRARLLVSDVKGTLWTSPEGPGPAFRGEVACGDVAGRIQVELRGELGGSPVLIARWAIPCGAPAATSTPLAAPAPWPDDPRQAEQRVLEGINAERTAVGIPALRWDDGLAGVARGVSDAIRAEVARGAFDVPTDLVARLRKAGIASPLVLQNPSQAATVQEAHEQLLASPAHRANLMNPDVNSGGIGAAPLGDPGGVVVTQLFIKELPPLDVVATREKLRAAVVQKRKDGRYPAAAPEPNLDEFAQSFARELAAAAGNLPKARQAELTKALDKQFKAVSLTFGARQDPLDFAEEPEVTAPGKHFGVGVALGMNEKLGRNAVYAVIAVGQDRGGKEEAPAAPRKGKKK